MRKDVYERIVQDALSDLPGDLRSRIQNVAIVIEDRPTREQLRAAGLQPPMTLLGLYQGVPLKDRGSWYGNVLPDKITIFRKPIEAQSPTWEALVRTVRQTVLHEVGHYFGLSEEQMQRIEQEWRAQRR